MANIKNVNLVEIRGNVRYAVKTDTIFTVSVVTRNPATGKADVPRAVAFDNIDHYNDICKVGKRVTIKGYIQTSKKYPGSTIVITDIIPELDRLNAKFEEKPYLPDINEIMLEGVLASVPHFSKDPERNFVRMTLCVPADEGRSYFVQLACYGKAAVRVAGKKAAGDKLRAICYMQTFTRIREDGSKIIAQRLVAQNIE